MRFSSFASITHMFLNLSTGIKRKIVASTFWCQRPDWNDDGRREPV